MADLENIQESFNYITEALDSMRAQNAVNTGNMDKVMSSINNQLDYLVKDNTGELTKVFLSELKRGLDERFNFVSDKFDLIENSFQNIIQKTDAKLDGEDAKDLFETVATNLTNFSNAIVSQKDLISQVGAQLDALQRDESKKEEIIRNISVLKKDVEKFGNGFESIVVNLNDNFSKMSTSLESLNSNEQLAALKKDIENIFLSSNAILSTMQVLDHKNKELEDTLTTFITKEDFRLEREQVAKLIAQNIELTQYINSLPTQANFGNLTEKIDTSIGVINALKNMINESGKQNQEMLSAQLDNLETKILNISSEDEFIGFRRELSEFARDVMDSTNLIRADLADTNSGLKNLYEFLNTMDIKNSFLNFTELNKTSESNIKEAITSSTGNISEEIRKKQEITKSDIKNATEKVEENLNKLKEDITENAGSNLANITNNIQSVIDTVASAKYALETESSANLEVISDKFAQIKESITNSSNLVVQSSQENLGKILVDIEKVFSEVVKAKQTIAENTNDNTQIVTDNIDKIQDQILNIKTELKQSSKENYDDMISIIQDFSQEIIKTKTSLEQNYGETTLEVRDTMGGLSLKLNSLQDVLTRGYEVNFSEVKELINALSGITQEAKGSLEQNATFGFSGLSANLEEITKNLDEVQENIENRSQTNFEKIAELFENLSEAVVTTRQYLNESSQVNFEAVSLNIQGLSKKLDEYQETYIENIKNETTSVKETIMAIPEMVRQNQLPFEDEKRNLINENARKIQDLGDKIQNLTVGIMAKDNSFKEDFFYNFTEIKSNLEVLRQELNQSNSQLDDNMTELISEGLEKVENAVNQYNNKYSTSFDDLQGRLVEYFDEIKQSDIESESKLNISLKDTFEIKAELEHLKDTISGLNISAPVNNLSNAISQKFADMIDDISQIEEKIEQKQTDALQGLFVKLEGSFENTLSEIQSYKNALPSELNNFGIDLTEKIENLRTQMSLASTDITSVLKNNAQNVSEKLSAIASEIEKVSSFDFSEAFYDIKSTVEKAHNALSSSLNENVERNTFEQTEKFAFEFEKLEEKLNIILSKVSSDNTKEIVELKSILTEKVDNISSINTILETVLARIEDITHAPDTVNDSLQGVKSELLDKLNTVEDIMLQSQGDLRNNINEKTAEIQNMAVSTIIEKISNLSDSLGMITKFSSDNKQDLEKSIIELKESSENNKNELADTILSANINALTRADLDEMLTDLQVFINNNRAELVESIKSINENIPSIENMEDSLESIKLQAITNKEDIVNKVADIRNSALLKEDVEQMLLDLQNYIANNKIELLNSLSKIEIPTNENLEVAIDELKQQSSLNKQELAEKIENISTQSLSRVDLEEFVNDLQSCIKENKKEVLGTINSIEIPTVEDLHTSVIGMQQSLDDIKEEINTVSFVHEQENIKNYIETKFNDIRLKLNALSDGNLEEMVANLDLLQEKIQSVHGDYFNGQERIGSLKNEILDKISDEIEGISFVKDKEEIIDFIEEKIDEIKMNMKPETYNNSAEILNALDILQEKISDINGNYFDIQNKIDILKDEMLDKLSEQPDVTESVDNGDLKEYISEKTEELQRNIENIKANSIQNLCDKLEEIEPMLLNQRNDLINRFDETKTALDELKETFVDTTVNTSMEVSSLLVNIQEDLSKLASKTNNEKIKEEFAQLNQKIDLISVPKQDNSLEELKNELAVQLKENFVELNSKLDLLAMSEDNARLSENLDDLKKLIISQNPYIKKLETFDKIDFSKNVTKEDLQSAKEDISQSFSNIQEKIETLLENINSNENTELQEFVETAKEQIIENLIDIFNQISFVAEVEDIKEFILENSDKLREDVKQIFDEKTNESRSILLEDIEDLHNTTNEKLNQTLKDTQNVNNELILTKIEELNNNSNENYENSLKDSLANNNDVLIERVEKINNSSDEKNEELLKDSLANNNDVLIERVEKISNSSDEKNEQLLKEVQNENRSILLEEIEALNNSSNKKLSSKLTQNSSDTKQEIVDCVEKTSREAVNDVITLLKESGQENKEELLDKIAQITNVSEENIVNRINENVEASNDETKTAILNSLVEQIEELKTSLENLSSETDAEAEKTQIEDLKLLINDFTENIEDKISEMAHTYGKSTEELVIDIKSNFYEKVQDSVDELKSSIEVLDNTDSINEAFSTLKEDLLDKVTEFSNSINSSFTELSSEVNTSLSEISNLNVEGIMEKIAQVKDELENMPRPEQFEIPAPIVNIDLDEVLSNLDVLQQKAEDVDGNCFDIKKEIEDVKAHILATREVIENAQEDDEDYSYTMQDVETDIAKIRMTLKELSETKPEMPEIDIDRITEDLTSLSTRTNKLLLNSDESYSSLKANLDDLKRVVAMFDSKVKTIDNQEPLNEISSKLDNLQNMMMSCVQSDKIFNQTFMYLAEWIDRTDEKMVNIEKNMLKKTDVEAMFEKFTKKFDKQQDKIKLLEEKITKLSKEPIVKPTATNIKAIVKEVLNKVGTNDKVDTKLAKKVDGIDRQLVTIGKSIEKITSYVDE